MVTYAQVAYQHCRCGMTYLIGYGLPKCLKIKCYNIHQRFAGVNAFAQALESELAV